MKRLNFAGKAGLVLLFIGVANCSPVAAEEILAVLSSEAPAYQEALAAFKETFQKPVAVMVLSKGESMPSGDPKIIVAFGGKAAIFPYANRSTLIYCLSPGLTLQSDSHKNAEIHVHVCPKPAILMSGLHDLQPTLKHLAVFWISPAFAAFFTSLQQAARVQGIELRAEKMNSPDEFPDRLRALKGKADAFWMAPDPLLMTPGVFAVAKEFGRSNNMPLYAPIDTLVDKGAVAAIAPSFSDMGKTAGRLATRVVAEGPPNITEVFSEENRLTVNVTAAAQSGLTFPPAAIKKADRVVP